MVPSPQRRRAPGTGGWRSHGSERSLHFHYRRLFLAINSPIVVPTARYTQNPAGGGHWHRTYDSGFGHSGGTGNSLKLRSLSTSSQTTVSDRSRAAALSVIVPFHK